MTSSLPRLFSFRLSAGFASGLLLLCPRSVFAESIISYKYEDYHESAGRIAVKTQGALFQQDLGPQMQLKVTGVIDAIAGATPNGQPAPIGSDQVVLTDIRDRRKAWNLDFSRQFPRVTLALGVANSRESDYTSTGWSINTLTDFNQKNTTVLAGVAGTSDDVKVFYQPTWAKKRSNDLILGVTQLLDAHSFLSLNFTWGRATGYLNDQYKLVQKDREVAPGVFLPFTFGENRPAERTKWIALASWNRDLPAAHAALEASYRFYHDTFGTRAQTMTLSWLQHLGSNFILQPQVRFHDQRAANFYYYDLDSTSIIPTAGAPNPAGPFYSSDYRLSALRTTLYGLKAIWTPSPRWQLDAAIDHYEMRGTDSITPRSAYPRAMILTFGARLAW